MNKEFWTKAIEKRLDKYCFTENHFVHISKAVGKKGYYILVSADNGHNMLYSNCTQVYERLRDVLDEIDRYVDSVIKGFQVPYPCHYFKSATWTYVPKGYHVENGYMIKD
jgi:hypothetical protein